MAYELDVTTWMPADMSAEEKAYWAEAYPDSPHEAAANAWESHAAFLAGLPADSKAIAVTSVSTGAQSVTYAEPASASQAAMDMAQWHWARVPHLAVLSPDYPTKRTPRSYPVPPTWPYAFVPCPPDEAAPALVPPETMTSLSSPSMRTHYDRRGLPGHGRMVEVDEVRD